MQGAVCRAAQNLEGYNHVYDKMTRLQFMCSLRNTLPHHLFQCFDVRTVVVEEQ